MLALHRCAVFTNVHKYAVSATLSAPLSSSASDPQQQPKSVGKHKTRDNRQRVAEGALHAATPALKHAANLYTKKGRASEGAYFVKEDRDALRKLVKKWCDEDDVKDKSGLSKDH